VTFTFCGGTFDGVVMDFSDPACRWAGSSYEESGQAPTLQLGVSLQSMSLYRRVLLDEDEALYVYDAAATAGLRECELIRRARH
jgi:hypothetical protein